MIRWKQPDSCLDYLLTYSSEMVLSRATKISILLAIDIVFFFVELIAGQ